MLVKTCFKQQRRLSSSKPWCRFVKTKYRFDGIDLPIYSKPPKWSWAYKVKDPSNFLSGKVNLPKQTALSDGTSLL